MTAECLVLEKTSESAPLKPSEGLWEPQERDGVLGHCPLNIVCPVLSLTLSSCDCLNRGSQKDRKRWGRGKERKRKERDRKTEEEERKERGKKGQRRR